MKIKQMKLLLTVLYNRRTIKKAYESKGEDDMANMYGKMLDDTFGSYYERFRELNALSKETAVTKEELFPEGQSLLDPDRMHKMLSAGIVKREGTNRYWLDEKVASNPNGVLKQRLMVVVLGVVLAVVLVLVDKLF